MRMTFKVTIIGALIVFFAVVIAVVFVPGLVWEPPQTVIAHPYSEDEQAGRVIFYSNGCNYCHTQYVRAEDTGMGEVSQGGNYVFDNPMILGSERTGPDLSYIGRKRSEAWEIEHWKNPRELSPLSIMPSFDFLSDDELRAMAAYLSGLGDRTAAQHMILPPAPYAGMSDPLGYPLSPPIGGEPQGWPTWEASHLQQGKETYVLYCLTCHGCAGNGLGSYGGTLTVTPANFKQSPFRAMPDEEWFWHVSEGIQGSVMPPWKESLTEEERWIVIRYVQQVFAHPVERDPDEGDPTGQYVGVTNPLPKTVETLDAGKHIFIRECWVCHGDAGRGEGIYRQGILPVPPDFGDGSYGDFTDADYFWRISEGVPWTAMPSWKVLFDEDDRWRLAYYIQVNFTQSEPRPPSPSPADQVYPAIDLAQTMPSGVSEVQIQEGNLPQIDYQAASLGAGQVMFTRMCARCHGFTGTGSGWAGQYLDPKPKDLTGTDVRDLSDGDFYARVTYGLQEAAMPSWGEWMPIAGRWNVINYIQQAFVVGMPSTTSVYGTGDVAADFAGASKELWVDEIQPISPTLGLTLYVKFCATCHGDTGQGNGPDTQNTPSGAPAAFAANMSEPYIIWRIWDGVPNSIMPPFSQFLFTGDLSEADIWDLVAYVESLPGQGGGQ
jgi:cytochrome c oxidase cbb3-type subunit 2